MEAQIKACQCGRSYIHCVSCGRRNPYYKKGASQELTIQRGFRVDCYRCSCGMEFTSETECKAPALVQVAVEYGAAESPWKGLDIRSKEYLNLFTEAALEKRKKKKIKLMDAYVELIREGWPLDINDMDEGLIELLKSKGLLNQSEENSQPKEASMRGDSNQNPPASSGENSLEDIIKAMNEEQK